MQENEVKEYKTLSEYIQDNKGKVRLTQAEIAAQCGINFTRYSRIHYGKAIPTEQELLCLIDTLELNPVTAYKLAGLFPSKIKRICLEALDEFGFALEDMIKQLINNKQNNATETP